MMIRTLTLAVLAAFAAAPMAFGQAQPGTVPAQPGAVPAQPGAVPAQNRPGAAVPGGTAATAGRAAVNDSLFAYAAVSAGQAQVSLSELGIQKATDPELKRFSQQMVQEHNRLNSQLMTVAQQRGLQLPRTPDIRAQFWIQSLAGLSGEEFDRCFAKAQLVAHMESVGMYQAEAERGGDPNIKAVASQAVPHLKEHLKAIKPIAMKYMKEWKEEQEEKHEAHEKDEKGSK